MSKPLPTTENMAFDQSSKDEIMENLIKRVSNSMRRAQIVALAHELSDGGENEKAFYSAVYHYSLRENWPQLDDDFKEFLPGGVTPVNPDGSVGESKASSNKPKTVKTTKPTRKRKGTSGS